MGNRRLGLSRLEAVIENLKRDINLSGSTLSNSVVRTTGSSAYDSAILSNMSDGYHGGAQGPNDDWGLTRPAMVTGLHRGLRVWSLDPTQQALSASLSVIDSQSDIQQSGSLAQTTGAGAVSTLSQWNVNAQDDATWALKYDDVDFVDGCMTLTVGGGAADQVGLQTSNAAFKIVEGRPMWIETSFKCADHDAFEMFFGFHEPTIGVKSWYNAAAAAGQDRVGWVKPVSDNDNMKITCTLNTAGTEAGGLAPETTLEYGSDNAIMSLGIMYDGKSTFKFYGGTLPVGAAGADRSPDMALLSEYTSSVNFSDQPLYAGVVFQGNTSAETFQVHYIRACKAIN